MGRKETKEEKWNNEGRHFVSVGNTADMDEHLDTYKPKIEVGKETSHPSKRR